MEKDVVLEKRLRGDSSEVARRLASIDGPIGPMGRHARVHALLRLASPTLAARAKQVTERKNVSVKPAISMYVRGQLERHYKDTSCRVRQRWSQPDEKVTHRTKRHR